MKFFLGKTAVKILLPQKGRQQVRILDQGLAQKPAVAENHNGVVRQKIVLVQQPHHFGRLAQPLKQEQGAIRIRSFRQQPGQSRSQRRRDPALTRSRFAWHRQDCETVGSGTARVGAGLRPAQAGQSPAVFLREHRSRSAHLAVSMEARLSARIVSIPSIPPRPEIFPHSDRVVPAPGPVGPKVGRAQVPVPRPKPGKQKMLRHPHFKSFPQVRVPHPTSSPLRSRPSTRCKASAEDSCQTGIWALQTERTCGTAPRPKGCASTYPEIM